MRSDIVVRDFNGEPFVRVCRSVEVSHRNPKRFEYDIEHDIAVFRIDDVAYAISNVCPHKREAVLHKGFVQGGTVTCPLHGRQYDIRSGENLTSGRSIVTYPVLETDGYVWVNIHGASTPTISP
jgi:nitrite reductase/ring-hydroxylating ferredoxin subunit